MPIKNFAITSFLILVLIISGCSEAKTIDSPIATEAEFSVVNYNDSDNSELIIKLPDNWTVTTEKRQVVDQFKFKQSKNNKISNYTVYHFDDGKSGQSSVLDLISYYKDQPNGAALPNHCSIKNTEYEGDTKLGHGVVYILNCDLPSEQATKENTTYDRVYALVPIEGEEKAYNFDAPINSRANAEDYIKNIISILKNSTATS
ncbi:hypothetical protein PaecuDRAFT_2171 [Paenibacillus curdlanolyticus YK9]|uniref:Lipoprotein n=1 Tax=Paenibacillus curdlanolyticus YK9 TaxID=717606 RepID=E0I937_9BACL|nr:hypothetical protein [Paenibacillus curdlanolyticus]EFM10921.1 hypothetical protein PaecuDRAFT_2171 [Paenibacillus curdlanolyticus YK9]